VLTESRASKRIQPLVKSARARMVCTVRWKQEAGKVGHGEEGKLVEEEK
jgi:hypothetical protein